MNKNNLFKGACAAAFALSASVLQAQTLDQVATLQSRTQLKPGAPRLQAAPRALPDVKSISLASRVPLKNLKSVPVRGNSPLVLNAAGNGSPAGARPFKRNKRITSGEGGEKPGTTYGVNKGVYNLVNIFSLGTDEKEEPIWANGGVLGYIDRPLTFFNTTPDSTYDRFSWDFGGETYEEDSLTMRPYFAANGYYFDTPKLTATLGVKDSTYQMGTSFAEGDTLTGMVATSGVAYVYNVDADASPFSNTFVTALNDADPWNYVLFGMDNTYKSSYLEWFDAPPEGGIFLWGTHFYVVTPSGVDLSQKTFQVDWVEVSGATDNKRKSFQARPTRTDLALQDVTFWEVNVGTDSPEFLVNNDFYVLITGPQDRTQWALMNQLDRDFFPNPERNTAYYVPTVGADSLIGQICQYVLVGVDAQGEEHEFAYNTSLDIHMFVATPYIILGEESGDIIPQDELDLETNGETHNYLLLDWFGPASAAPQVSITASVSESTGGDWLTVTPPTTASSQPDFFSFSLTAGAKEFDVDGRRATVTLTDNKGFSRRIVVYQGDHAAADKELHVSAVNASGKVSAKYADGRFAVTYPTDYTQVRIYTPAGRQVAVQALSGNGTDEISAGFLGRGLYLLQFVGKDTQTVKVLK